jgi:hypothetical protein
MAAKVHQPLAGSKSDDRLPCKVYGTAGDFSADYLPSGVNIQPERPLLRKALSFGARNISALGEFERSTITKRVAFQM